MTFLILYSYLLGKIIVYCILWIFTSCSALCTIYSKKKEDWWMFLETTGKHSAASVCNGKKTARQYPKGDHFWGLYTTVEAFLSVIWFSFSFSANFCHFYLLMFLWKTQLVIFLSSHFMQSLPLASIVSSPISLSYPPTLPFPSVTFSHYLLRKCMEKRKSRDTANRRFLEQRLFCNKYSEIITFEPAALPIWSHRWLGRGQGALKLRFPTNY